MPPWYIEKSVGVQHFKNNPSLTEAEIAKIATWVDGGAPRGNPADAPPRRVFTGSDQWDIGPPDLVVSTPTLSMKAGAPDWWGAMPPIPVGLADDRYVSAIQVKEFNTNGGSAGGKFIFHHALMNMLDVDGKDSGIGGWPNTTTERFGTTFERGAGRLVRAGSQLQYHCANG